MRIVPNTGTDRVVDIVRPWLRPGNRVDLASGSDRLFNLHGEHGEWSGEKARNRAAIR